MGNNQSITMLKTHDRVEYKNQYGQLHREDGPAVIHNDGSQEWCMNNRYHRIGGPAVSRINGTKMWFLDGRRHRVGGPAIEREDGTEEFWVNGRQVSTSTRLGQK